MKVKFISKKEREQLKADKTLSEAPPPHHSEAPPSHHSQNSHPNNPQ
jgi:hypothetical protein